MASWGVYDSRLSALCTLTEMSIHREVGNIANVSFTTTGAVAVGDTVDFRAYVGPTTYITVLSGQIISCKQNAQKLYACQAVENNDDLRYYQAEYENSRIINIDNALHTLQIKDYVAKIIDGTRWTDGTLDTSVYIPNTTDYLPSIRIANSYVSSALDKFLKNTCGYDIWYNSTTKTIYYGEYRTDRTGTDLAPLYSERITSDVQHNVARIIVYGSTNSIMGTALKTGAVAPYRTLMYRYADAKDAIECEKIAKQVLNDRQYTLDRYEASFTIESLFDAMPYEGDKIHIHSPDVGLDDDKGVKDVTFSLLKVTLGLGYPAITIFDLLGSKLVEIGGSAETGTELTWDGGWQHVDVDATTGPAVWKIQIDDLDLIGDDFTLELHLHKWVKDLSTLPSLAGMIADGHISGVSADRALAGMTAAKALAGMTAVKALSGVSGNKALAGVSVNDMNTCGSVVSINYIDGNANTISSAAAYTQICADTLIGDTATGRSFGILHGTISVYNNTPNWVKWYLDVRQPSAGSILDRPIIIDIPPSGGSNQYHTVPFMCLLPWSASLSTDDRTLGVYAKKYDSGQDSITCYGVQITMMQVGRHSHSITEPNSGTGHDTSITEPNSGTGHNTSLSEPNTGEGHDTSLTEPNAGDGHNTSVNDPTHDHTLEEPNDHTGHETNEDDTKTEVDSFPTDVDVYVNDVKINATPFPGGVDETIEQIIPKTAFTAGENTIMVKSTVKGSVYAFGLYTQYGSG